MNFLPYLVLLLVLFGLLIYGQNRRRRQIAQEMVRVNQIGFGDEVMTTSGLYGTVVGRNDDGTVQLAIAPGVEVRWALAALRDPESLPEQYRRGMPGHSDADPDAEPPDDAGEPPR
jgi:preprotein translocase subunit YajC